MADSTDTTVLPRRQFLARGAPFAGLLALPAGAQGLIALTPRGDAAIIATARRAAALQDALSEAQRRFGDLDDAFTGQDLLPEPPVPDADRVNEACLAVLRQFPVITPQVDKAVAAMRRRTLCDMQAAHEAWRAEYRRRYEASGAGQAGEAADAAFDAAAAEVEALADMRATTLQGLLAKASVFRDEEVDDGPAHHHRALAWSVMRDLQAMAGLPRSA